MKETTSFKIWYQLVGESGKPLDGTSKTAVKLSPTDLIVQFRDAIKKEHWHWFFSLDSSMLKVYANQSALEADPGLKNPLDPSLPMGELGRTYADALWVVVPINSPQSRIPISYEQSLRHVTKLLESHKDDLVAFKNQPFKTMQLKGNTIPLLFDYPQLLLHELDVGDGWTDWKAFAESNNNFLQGLSGAGKTRMMFELLARKWGFYFTCQLNPYPFKSRGAMGSADFDYAIELMKNPKVAILPPMQRFFNAENCFRILFLCRYCVMEYVKNKLGYSPLNWLQLQVFRLHDDDKNEFKDILFFVFKEIMERFSSIEAPINISQAVPTVIEGANLAFKTLPQSFPQSSVYAQIVQLQGSDADVGHGVRIEATRSIFSAVLYAFNALTSQVILVGCRLPVAALKEDFPSKTMTDTGDHGAAWAFKYFDKFEDFQKLLSKYLGLDNLSCQDIHFAYSYLRGRARFVVAFINSLLDWQHHTHQELTTEIFRYRLKIMIKKFVLPCEGRNLYEAVDDFTTQHPQPGALQDIVMSYYLPRNPPTFSVRDSENFEIWIKCGIGRNESSSEDVVSINEPLVLLAGYKYFDPLVLLLKSVDSLNEYSDKHSLFQSICFELLKRNWFQNGETLHSLLGLFVSPLPPWLSNSEIILHPFDSIISLRQPSGSDITFFLEQAFSGCKTSAFYVPADSQKIDGFTVLQLGDQFVSVCIKMIILHADSDMSEAMKKARETVLSSRLENQLGVPKDLHRRFSAHIGIVIAYGTLANQQQHQVEVQFGHDGKPSVYLTIDARNYRFFSEPADMKLNFQNSLTSGRNSTTGTGGGAVIRALNTIKQLMLSHYSAPSQ